MQNRDDVPVFIQLMPGIAGISAIPAEEAVFGSNNVRLEWDASSPYVSLGSADAAPPVTVVPVGTVFYVHAKFRTIFHNATPYNYEFGWCVGFSVYGGGLSSFNTQSTIGPLLGGESVIDSYFKASFTMPNTQSLNLILKVWFGDKMNTLMGGNPPQPWN